MPIRMFEEPPAAYDDVAEAYGRTFDQGGTGLDDRVLTDLLGDVRGQTVLSLACGQGQDARLLASLGAYVTGIDVSKEMLRHARAHETSAPRGIDYVQGDAQELGAFTDASFDGVLCHMALMDIRSLSSTIASVGRVLRERSWFVFSIVHPCFHGHVEAISDYLLDHRYAKRAPGDALPGQAYHRPLAAYVNELAAVGLHLERLAEVRHAAQPGGGGVPELLYARAAR
jgi:ubiquinone/menaquinone biosynthesis C-methylase UbiE